DVAWSYYGSVEERVGDTGQRLGEGAGPVTYRLGQGMQIACRDDQEPGKTAVDRRADGASLQTEVDVTRAAVTTSAAGRVVGLGGYSQAKSRTVEPVTDGSHAT